MEKRRNLSSHLFDFKNIQENKNILNEVLVNDNDLSGKAQLIISSFNFLLNSNDGLKEKVEKILDFMDQYDDLDKAANVKYRLNITTSKTGIKFYQLKGAIGYQDKKKLWVSLSLGNEKAVLKKYGTTDSDKIKDLMHTRMVWKTYEAYRKLRLK